MAVAVDPGPHVVHDDTDHHFGVVRGGEAHEVGCAGRLAVNLPDGGAGLSTHGAIGEPPVIRAEPPARGER